MRLFYVAMTRAKKQLYISYHLEKKKSIFIDTIGEQYKNYKIIWMVSNKKEVSCHNKYKNKGRRQLPHFASGDNCLIRIHGRRKICNSYRTSPGNVRRGRKFACI